MLLEVFHKKDECLVKLFSITVGPCDLFTRRISRDSKVVWEMMKIDIDNENFYALLVKDYRWNGNWKIVSFEEMDEKKDVFRVVVQ